MDLLAITESVVQNCHRSGHSVEERSTFLSLGKNPLNYTQLKTPQVQEHSNHHNNVLPRDRVLIRLKSLVPTLITEISDNDKTVKRDSMCAQKFNQTSWEAHMEQSERMRQPMRNGTWLNTGSSLSLDTDIMWILDQGTKRLVHNQLPCKV